MDSTADTLRHIRRVNELVVGAAINLLRRAVFHDESKLHEPEKSAYDELPHKLAGLTYGSEKYKQQLKDLGPALEHHYAYNSHHPQHYPNGVDGMDLFDLIEMFFDWKAAGERHNDGNIYNSITINTERFSLSPQLVNVLNNTAARMGYGVPPETPETQTEKEE